MPAGEQFNPKSNCQFPTSRTIKEEVENDEEPQHRCHLSIAASFPYMAVSKQPSITPETSSGEGLDEEQSSRGEAKWKRFHPFRVVRKIFRRRVKRSGSNEVQDASKKSWSTSELQCVQEDTPNKYEGPSHPYKIGLSVSHDSIFSPDSSSNLVNPEELNRPQGSSLSVQHAGIKNMFKDELYTRVRARRDSDDDDIGLPHSPCTSPTTVDVLTQGLKDKSFKSQTTCSAGSLISMGSSENDEDSVGQLSSGHSSRMSLLDRRSMESEGDPDVTQPVPLNHKAAHHKIAVRPKRTYGLPQRRLKQLAACGMSTLPSTPEVMEDNGKSAKIDSSGNVQVSSASVVSSSEVTTSTLSQTVEKHFTSDLSTGVTLTEEISATKLEKQLFQQQQISETSANMTKNISTELTKHDEVSLNPLLLEVISEATDKSSISEWAIINEDKTCTKSTVKDKCNNFQKIGEDVTQITGSSLCKGTRSSVSETSNVKESVKVLKTHFEEIKCKEEHVLKSTTESHTDEVQLSVSAMVKSLESSDNASDNEKPTNFRNDVKTVTKSDNTSIRYKTDKADNVAEICVSHQEPKGYFQDQGEEISDLKCDKSGNRDIKAIGNISCNTSNEPEVSHTSKICISDSQSRNYSSNHLFLSKNDSVSECRIATTSDIYSCASEQHFMHRDRKSPDRQTDRVIMSSLFPEEESIMSEKDVPVCSSERLLNEDDNKILISHHISSASTLQEQKVTEAHNIVSVDEHFTTSIQALQTLKSEENIATESHEEPWISSVDITSSKENTEAMGVTVKSVSSQMSKRMSEDKITISVNAAAEEIKTKTLEMFQEETIKSHSMLSNEARKNSDTTDSKAKLCGSDSIHVTTGKKEGLSKSIASDEGIGIVHRNINAQKRVSVEIVPFSQRMKERKYQPLSFPKEDVVIQEPSKANSNVAVERKSSGRKNSTKQKQDHKTYDSSRHSSSSSTGSNDPVVGNDKQGSKSEKLQYPVHIRIRKGKSKNDADLSKDSGMDKVSDTKINSKIETLYNQESSCEVKFQLQSAKETQNESKPILNYEAHNTEAPAKWEVKIQPAMRLKKDVSSVQNNNEISDNTLDAFPNNSDMSENQDEQMMETGESDANRKLCVTVINKNDLEDRANSPNPMSESPPMKSRENSWRSVKETPSSGDSEPELFRVFARRSIKQRNFEKGKLDSKDDKNLSDTCSSDDSLPYELQESFEEGHKIINISNNSTVIKISEPIETNQEKKSPDLVKKKSKSFSEKEIPRSVSPLQQSSLNRRRSHTASEAQIPQPDVIHRRQRLTSVPDIPLTLPPNTDLCATVNKQQNGAHNEENSSLSNKSESLQRASSLSVSTSSALANGSSSSNGIDALKTKENQDAMNNKDAPTPAWLQLAQQRRELREQRERLLLGSSTSSFVLESSSKPSRSSKVWDMVNNFQKMQMT